jgi:uncharacterized OB-fold protein
VVGVPTDESIPSTAADHEQRYWRRVADGDVCVARCRDCGEASHPPRRYCPNCYSDDWTFESIEGTGTVYGYTQIHRPAERSEADAPVLSVIVTLDEGPRIMGRMPTDPAAIEVGSRIRLDPTTLSADDVRLTFRPLSE